MARILIIDDDRFMCETLKRVFEGENHEVLIAGNGREGLELFRRERADLIITDILMPEKDGLESIAELKSEYPGLPIIAISGGGSRTGGTEFLEAASMLGADEVMRKPLVIRRLLETAARLVARGGGCG